MYIGNEPLRVGGHDIALTVNDFWRWSFSDFSDFSTRDVFSKFLVASSLGLTADGSARQHCARNLLWSPTGSAGIRISVRTAAYVQSGEAEHPDHILFVIPKKPDCDVRLFCVFKGMTGAESPLKTDLWDFYALCSNALSESMSGRGYVTLPALMGLNPVWSDYYGIGDAIQKAMSSRLAESPGKSTASQ